MEANQRVNGKSNLNFDKGNNKTKILNLGMDPEVKGVLVQFPILVQMHGGKNLILEATISGRYENLAKSLKNTCAVHSLFPKLHILPLQIYQNQIFQ